jgi:uncharacterized membrane protein
MRTGKGMLIASAAAGLIIAGAVAAHADSHDKAGGDVVSCTGVNACKGQGSCAGPGGNSCAGKNECKGKGVMEMSAADCAKKGGKVFDPKMK